MKKPIDHAYKTHLTNLLQEEWFNDYLQQYVLPAIPPIPSYSPGNTEETVETWKYVSGLNDGAWLVLQQLGIKYER